MGLPVEPLFALVTPDLAGENVVKTRRLLEKGFSNRFRHRYNRARKRGEKPCAPHFRFAWLTPPGYQGEGIVEVYPNCFCFEIDEQKLVFTARIARDFSEVRAHSLPRTWEEKLGLTLASYHDTLKNWRSHLGLRVVTTRHLKSA
jgi:hypothetical protein